MGDTKFLMFGVLAVAGLAYCLWKTQADLRGGFGWSAAWGVVASLSAFFFLAFLFASKVLKDL